MGYYAFKVLVTSLLVVTISEIAKRSSLVAAVLASVPLISVLAMVWLYLETGDIAKVRDLAVSVFWLVLPSLALFVALPLLLDRGLGFFTSLLIATALTVVCYGLTLAALRLLGGG